MVMAGQRVGGSGENAIIVPISLQLPSSPLLLFANTRKCSSLPLTVVAPKPWMDRRAALDISAAFEILTFIAYLLFFASHHVNFRHLDVTVAVSDVRASSEARPGEQEMSAVEVFEGAGAEGA
uniref:Uncharacterized protein n=1 Tax=Palpitomonas bilix TaxID=652834 RepID=A0A7S3D4B0_9EUKA|mmetsp:Transcript_21171/g.55051  ORF Transcript_21171/g.55051 Transcript_21171/m.55051 type:complete len:123 (+) Transcript_21171:143-511(+)